MSQALERVEPTQAHPHPVRVVTAASLFDGHDAAINIMRRLLQKSGAEVIHLGLSLTKYVIGCLLLYF